MFVCPVQLYRTWLTIQVSQRYLDLTKKKLELARLPRELSDDEDVNEAAHGVTKAELEPLLDFWYARTYHLILPSPAKTRLLCN